MKRHQFAAVVLVSLATVAFAITDSDNKPGQKLVTRSTSQENAALKQEFRQLKDRLAALEERLAKLETRSQRAPQQVITNFQFTLSPQSANLRSRPGVIIPKGVVPQESKPPKTWGEGEVNGWKFYKVPLNSEARK